MQIGAPGNVDKGFCLKCKIPLLVELPDQIRYLCHDCVRNINEMVKHGADNPNIKRTVLEPGQYIRTRPDGVKERLRVAKGRR